MEIHGYSIRRSINSDVFVSNCLIDLYAKSRYSARASNVFETMERRSVVTWNVMVANFVLNKQELEAIRLITTMQAHGEHPNSITFTNVLPAIGRISSLFHGKEIHAASIRKGFSFDLYVSNALMDMYAKCCCLHMSRNIFKTSAKDEVSYNILITSYSQSEHCLEAMDLFLEMARVALKHDIVSFTGVLSACANLFAIKQGKEIHGFFIRTSHSHIFVANSLLDMYTKCGKINIARRVFNQVPDKDVVSWNTMILGYGMLGEVDVAVDLFESMRDSGVDYDLVSYLAVLSACSHGGRVERGLSYFNEMLARDIKPTNMHYACMIDLLGRAGRIKEAVEIIRELPNEADANIWGSLLGACKIHGNIGFGRWAAKHLFELKPEHCGYYMLLSNMYAELGKWEEANETRELMKLKGGRKNPGCSWVEICDQIPAFAVGEKIEDTCWDHPS
ncbi:hypothetical protein Sjap_006401 [Stephania japonica]|uniref:Pentatricopeptide repeat-containing protein n=1 Tax=Stephania japonica TaxID=461633 RepID=A0AAP0PIV9_9MAGN